MRSICTWPRNWSLVWKLVSCSGLLHLFVLGAVCRGRQRGWWHLERFLCSSSLGIFLSCLFLGELLLYELHIIVYRCLSLELQIYYLKLSPFLHNYVRLHLFLASFCFVCLSILRCFFSTGVDWSHLLHSSKKLSSIYNNVMLFFLFFDCLSSSNLVLKTVQSTHPAMLACRAEKDWAHHTGVTCII